MSFQQENQMTNNILPTEESHNPAHTRQINQILLQQFENLSKQEID